MGLGYSAVAQELLLTQKTSQTQDPLGNIVSLCAEVYVPCVLIHFAITFDNPLI